MSTQSTTGESFGSNLLMGVVIAASAFLLYAALWLPQAGQTVPAPAPAASAIEQVVVIAPHHVS
jgi:hypothetical protein